MLQLLELEDRLLIAFAVGGIMGLFSTVVAYEWSPIIGVVCFLGTVGVSIIMYIYLAFRKHLIREKQAMKEMMENAA